MLMERDEWKKERDNGRIVLFLGGEKLGVVFWVD